MSIPMTQLGGSAFNHDQSSGAEEEYDRLRDLARKEHSKRQHCFDQAHNAYESGDGARAHELSEEGKKHGAQMDKYNKQASDFIFRENNAEGRVDGDTIDLHGQFVEEAEDILEQRIRYAQSQGQSHLHVIVGKGNHSVNHVQKLKPRVEQVCQELGLQYKTEENAGRIYVNLTGGPADMPPQHHGRELQQHHQEQHHGGQSQQHDQQQQHQSQQQQYGGQQGYPGQQQQQQEQGQGDNENMEETDRKPLPKLLRAFKSCCVVM